MPPHGLIIAAPTSGVGKTTVTLALLRALRDRGLSVAGGKCGPDYIDPAFHAAACGQPSLNYDPWAMSPQALRHQAGQTPADLLMIEAAMGVIDGAGLASTGSAADLAETLSLPLILVIDAAKTGASAVLPIAGLQTLRPNLRIAGVLLNRVGSPRHQAIIAAALSRLDIPLLGALPRSATLTLPERHLGLVQAMEHPALEAFLTEAAAQITRTSDLDQITQAAQPIALAPPGPGLPPLGQRIALAQDAAFAFAYPHMLQAWRAAGAQILPFSPLADQAPDRSADAIFLPGGYPELHAGPLAAATTFHAGMQHAAAQNTLIYGECGGYMTLGFGLTDAGGTRHRMLGLLPVETSFQARKLTLGYRRLTPGPSAPWTTPLMAHEFHYATILSEPTQATRLFEATDADQNTLPAMGLTSGNTHGAFAHIIAPAT